MTTWLTPIVLLVAAAAVLGLIVGWCISYLFAARAHNRLVAQSDARVRQVKSRLEAATATNTRLTQDVERINAELLGAQQKLSDESVQRSAQVKDLGDLLTRKDRQRLDLERQLKALEDQQLRVQRDITQFRLFKNREVEQLREQLGLNGAVATGVASGAAIAQASEHSSSDPAQDSTHAATGSDHDSNRAAADSGMPSGSAAGPAHDSASGHRADMAAGGVSSGGAPLADVAESLPDITHVVLESEEDVLDMTSEFDFDPAQLLDDTSEHEPVASDDLPAINLASDGAGKGVAREDNGASLTDHPLTEAETRGAGILDRFRNRR